jgi:hypothetical protein
MEKVISDIEQQIRWIEEIECHKFPGWLNVTNAMRDALALLKEQEAKQYNSHEVACIIADLFGDPCACNFNDIDTWLPYKCDFRDTCCPNPVGVACWEQYLKHREGR